MNYPPRLGHLATRQVVVAKWVTTFASQHHIDDEEARERLDKAFAGKLYEDMLALTWEALLDGWKKDEAGLLEKVARSLRDRPLKQAKPHMESAELSAFLIVLDIHAGTASDAARRLMERPEGAAMAQKGLKFAGRVLALELSKK